MENPPESSPPRPRSRRRWLTFSLASLLLAVTIVGLLLMPLVNRARSQRDAVAAVEALGGRVTYDFQADGLEGPASGPQWLRRWIGDEYFQSVRRIELRQKGATDEVLELIGALDELESLDVADGAVTDAGLQHVAGLKKLKALDVSFNDVTDTGLAHMSDLPELVYLDLSATNISDEGLEQIAALPKLYTLKLFGAEIGDAATEHIARIETLGDLDVGNTNVSDAGLAPLVRLPELRRLRIDKNGGAQPTITDQGFEHLAQMKGLMWLEVSNSTATDAGLKKLEALSGLKSLSVFCFQKKYSDQGVQDLQQAIPGLQVR